MFHIFKFLEYFFGVQHKVTTANKSNFNIYPQLAICMPYHFQLISKSRGGILKYHAVVKKHLFLLLIVYNVYK